MLGDVIPLCFQLSSLVFGFIRYKKNNQIRITEQSESNLFTSQRASSISANSYFSNAPAVFFDPPLLNNAQLFKSNVDTSGLLVADQNQFFVEVNIDQQKAINVSQNTGKRSHTEVDDSDYNKPRQRESHKSKPSLLLFDQSDYKQEKRDTIMINNPTIMSGGFVIGRRKESNFRSKVSSQFDDSEASKHENSSNESIHRDHDLSDLKPY